MENVGEYIKFTGKDRDYSSFTSVWKPTKGYELLISLDARHADVKKREFLLNLLRSHGFVSDYNEWTGYIMLLPERAEPGKDNEGEDGATSNQRSSLPPSSESPASPDEDEEEYQDESEDESEETDEEIAKKRRSKEEEPAPDDEEVAVCR